MKKLLLIAALFLVSMGVYSQGVWLSQATGFSVTSSGVRNVSAVDTNVVWISSYDGSGGGASRQDFSHTIDGGATWVAGNVTGVPASHDWSMIYGTDANHAWAMFYNATAGSGGGIWATTDGGVTWAQQGVGTIFNASSFPDVVHFWDNNNGFAMGDPNPGFEIYTTTDGGTTWTATPSANIPAPLSGEYGIVAHYAVIGDTIWFDTNKGRVYRSIDRGLNWTVAATGITVPANGAMDICFTSGSTGIARLYNQTSGGNTTVKSTVDGGDTWTTLAISGNLWGSDMKYVPGTTGMMVSTGAMTGFVGSSYSLDNGATWTDIETIAQRTALGIVDSLHMWCGGFTTSPTDGGIFIYTVLPTITCSDASINPGTSAGTVTQICGGDTLIVTSTGVVAPTVGDFSGVSWVISSADISGTSDPLNDPSLIASYTFTFPAPSVSARSLINDGSLIDGTVVPYGAYYWTPVVFGNATDATGTGSPVFLGDLNLDVNCTYAGASVMCDVLDPADPNCTGVGIAEINASKLAVYSNMKDNMINVQINAAAYGKTSIEVVDLAGRIMYTSSVYVAKGVNHEMIDATSYAAGTYMIHVESNGLKAVSKLVKF